MNIQFSVTANAAPKELGEFRAMVSSSNGIKDLDRLEQQGVVSASPGQEQLISRIEKAVKSLEGPQTTLDISIHDKTHELMVKVLNKETGEVIREVPNEKVLDLVAKMMELAGILVDKRV